MVAAPGRLPLGRRRAREIRDVEELVGRNDHGQLDAQRIELPGVFVGGLALLVDDAPALFGGHAAVAGPEAQARPAGAELRRPLAAGDLPAAGHDGPQVDLGQALAGFDGHVEHRAGSLLDRGLFEVAGRLFVVRGHRGRVGAGDVDLLGRAGRPVGAAAAAAEDVDDLQRRGHPRGIRLGRYIDQRQPADDQDRPAARSPSRAT